jgi:hypothetical protein
MEIDAITNYESMPAESRVGVFNTGFHYGWRKIVTLAMMCGLPLYCGPFHIHLRQDLTNYRHVFNKAGDWEDLNRVLSDHQDDDRLATAKEVNRRFFDENLTPEAVATKFLCDVAFVS